MSPRRLLHFGSASTPSDRRPATSNSTRRPISATRPQASVASPRPIPDAWADAAARWTELGDRWATATALVREAEAAAMTGSADRAASSLRTAHSIASELGAVPLLAEIDAVSRRTRVSVAAPTPRGDRRDIRPRSRADRS